MANRESTARRYLLGEATGEECTALEQEYLSDESALDAVATAEEDLIEDYLAATLPPVERERFERVYLATPAHRARVETIRRLQAAARSSSSTTRPSDDRRPVRIAPGALRLWRFEWLALAATLVLVVTLGMWLYRTRDRETGQPIENPAPPATVSGKPAGTPAAPPASPDQAPQSAPRVFAVSISPIAVRSADDTTRIVIPPGTDMVALSLEADPQAARFARARASVRPVGGQPVWQGPASLVSDPRSGAAARVDIPAAQLRADDYLIELSGTDAAGIARGPYEYFLRVRAR